MKNYQLLFNWPPSQWAFDFHDYGESLMRLYRWVLCFGPIEVRRFYDDN